MKTIHELSWALDTFANERNWEQYHTPKNLAMALSAESGELLHTMLWLTPEESYSVEPMAAVEDEMADILIYLVRLADVLRVDLMVAVEKKIRKNAIKHPAPGVMAGKKLYSWNE
jgi:NTP pyrophosphatase (non-canonical NTP hydrolase)